MATKYVSIGRWKNCTIIDDSSENVIQLEDVLGNISSLLKKAQSAIASFSTTYYGIIDSTGGTVSGTHTISGTNTNDDLATIADSLNTLKDAIDDLSTTQTSILTTLRTHGLIET